MVEILERGAVAFVWRPRVETPFAQDLEDVQRFWVALAPEAGPPLRRVAIGRKRLPDAGRRQRFWGYVDRLAATPEGLLEDVRAGTYRTKTRGVRFQPGPRIAAAGAYAFARHGRHVHLAYALSRAVDRRGVAPEELGIAPEATFVAAVFRRSVRAALDARAAADPRRFVPAHPTLLDAPGVEIVLVATRTHEEAALREALAGPGLADPLVRALSPPEAAPPG
jgi:hypothetical protein